MFHFCILLLTLLSEGTTTTSRDKDEFSKFNSTLSLQTMERDSYSKFAQHQLSAPEPQHSSNWSRGNYKTPCQSFEGCMQQKWSHYCKPYCNSQYYDVIGKYTSCMTKNNQMEPLYNICGYTYDTFKNCSDSNSKEAESSGANAKYYFIDCFGSFYTNCLDSNVRRGPNDRDESFKFHDHCKQNAWKYYEKNYGQRYNDGQRKGNNVSTIAIATPIAILSLIILGLVFALWRYKKRKPRILPFGNPVGSEIWHEPKKDKDKWELPGSHLVLLDDLGQGAFGRVYKGKIRDAESLPKSQFIRLRNAEREPVEFVAVKQCHEYADEFTKRDFLREIVLMKKVGHHERLVNILFCVTTREPLSLVVEYCQFGDLLHYLKRIKVVQYEDDDGKMIRNLQITRLASENVLEFNKYIDLKVKDLISFMYQISDGMQYLSQKGYVHCDLAARNMMVFKDRQLKIGDFGLCRFLSNDCVYLSKGGRLPIKWMAVEAIQNYEFTTNTDIWSFGIVMYEIITTGKSPYCDVMPSDGDYRGAMLNYLKDGNRMEKPETCPQEIFELMSLCWSEEPTERPSFDVLKENLRKILELSATTNYYKDVYTIAINDYNTVIPITEKVDETILISS